MIHYVALLLYISALILWVRSFLEGGRGRMAALAFGVAAAGVTAHTVALARFTVINNELPLVGLAPSLSTMALIIGVGLLATIGLGEVRRVGIVLIPVVILMEGTAVVLGVQPTEGVLDFQGAWFALHVTLAFAGYSGMTVAFSASLLYLLQFNTLKAKRLGPAFRFLPPLATLDRLGRIGLVAGLITLTLGLAIGWAWTVRFRHSFQQTDPAVIWGVLTWAVFVGVLMVRGRGGEYERRGALATVVGFTVVVAAYVVLRLAASTGGFFLR
ncbi:MAG: hypothetical protein BMS9Abin29_1490 [Gemmatimonadota bacterium]|nr:MAG: hypothetical protein BMS9Abin29_1490 [Gemmatimonadota bacterium]